MVQISLVLSPCCCKISLEQIEFTKGSDAGSSNFASQEISVKKKQLTLGPIAQAVLPSRGPSCYSLQGREMPAGAFFNSQAEIIDAVGL